MATRNPTLTVLPSSAKKKSILHCITDFVGPRKDDWFTGLHPTKTPGFDGKTGTLRSLPYPNLRQYTRQGVLDYFDNCWTATEVLFSCLQGREAFVRQPYHQLRHPMMFYYGHPAVLYINKFRVAGLLDQGINTAFEQLFETGVDEMSWDDLSQSTEDWPSVEEVHEYRKQCYAVVRHVLQSHPCLDGGEVTWDSPGWAIFMAFEHEHIHLETSSVLIRELPVACVCKPEYWPDYHPSAYATPVPSPQRGVHYPENPLRDVQPSTVILGKPYDYPSFGWDNEYGARAVDVQPFRASQHKVSNGEFLDFVRAGGYHRPQFWSKDGWGWRTFRNVKWPTFWIPDGPAGLHQYKLRAQFSVVPMPWAWPVDANYHEARAYCAWRADAERQAVGYRLATEAEHMLLRNARDRPDVLRPGQDALDKASEAGGGAAAAAAAAATVQADIAADGSATAAANGGGSGAPDTGRTGTAGSVAAATNGHVNGHSHGDSANGHTNGHNNGHANGHSSSHTNGHAAASDPSLNIDAIMTCAGADVAQQLGANLQMAYGSQSPVDFLPPTAGGFYDAMGNSWEWGEDHFAPYPGFRIHPYYPDFSAPCFAGEHQMILGGSFMSKGHLASKYARYQFRAHFFQHASFRVFQSVLTPAELAGAELAALPAAASMAVPGAPALPWFETSCMDAPPPYVGTGPCCRTGRDSSTAAAAGDGAGLADHAARLAAARRTYESEPLLGQYLSLHFGTAKELLAGLQPAVEADVVLLASALDFPRRCGEAMVAFGEKVQSPFGRALDLGCAVGRSTFEMARRWRHVIGVDISASFIAAAQAMQAERHMEYTCKIEGDVQQSMLATLGSNVDTSRVEFLVGDACALPAGVGEVDAVLAANLLCRVPDPAACLCEISRVLAPGGLLMLTSPFTWLEEYTARECWVGGRNPELRSASELKRALEREFEVVAEDQMLMAIRETARKFQLVVPHRLVLRKRSV